MSARIEKPGKDSLDGTAGKESQTRRTGEKISGTRHENMIAVVGQQGQDDREKTNWTRWQDCRARIAGQEPRNKTDKQYGRHTTGGTETPGHDIRDSSTGQVSGDRNARQDSR